MQPPACLTRGQTAWEALSWADVALAGAALAALVITLAVALADRGDVPRLLLFLLGAVATVIVVAYGAAPAVLGGPGAPQTAVWVALAASVSLLAGADGIQMSFGSGTRTHDPEAWLAQGMYYGDLGGSAGECGGSGGDLGGFGGDPGGFGGDCSV
jgi:hypothetical protein